MGIQDLYDKVASFEAQLTTNLNCKNGCSGCCYVDLSVFELEANNVRRWFKGLAEKSRDELREKWKSPLKEGACAFLRDESCTIYPARPLICRTQGLAFKFRLGGEEYLDICPLNEEKLELMGEGEILNLDLINLILSQLEKNDSNDKARARVLLTDLLKELALT